ncbi:MAG: hypothetical protein NTV94_06780 [Planctomycetota bacterium]|nr:hypothetical protein [Planctomycetota bacterium]
MADQKSEAKTCSVCGQDCSKTQRTKDAKGNYICAACVEHAKQTKQAQQKPASSPAQAASKASPKQPAEGDNSFLLELGGRTQALEGGKQCPSCDRVLNQTDRVCLGCGYDTQLGRKTRTKVEAAPKIKQIGGGGSQKQIVIALVVLGLLGAGAWYYFQSQG